MSIRRERGISTSHSPGLTHADSSHSRPCQAGAVLVAAGSGQRMGNVDKATLPLLGRPALDWVLDAFIQVARVGPIVVVAGDHNREAVRRIVNARDEARDVLIVEGASFRAGSVANGVAALPDVDLVVIHDVARPLVTPDLIERGLDEAERSGAVIAAISISDTIKQIDDRGNIVRTIERASLRAAQTPQVFQLDRLRRAYTRFGSELTTMTDEAMLLERAGFAVATYPGAPENIKLTIAADLPLAESLLRRREEPATR